MEVTGAASIRGGDAAPAPPEPPADPAAAQSPVTTQWHPPHPVDVRLTLAPLYRGSADPTMRFDPTGVWRTAGTPAGDATLRLIQRPGGTVDAMAWGPGAEWAIDQLPELLGEQDDWAGFDCTGHPLLHDTRRGRPGIRIPRTALVFEVLVPAVLEQRVIGSEARHAWSWLVGRHGRPAPGPAPAGMRVCPPAQTWLGIPVWDWHRAGVDPGRARTIMNAARVASGLERTLTRGRGGPEVIAALRTVPGIGLWTAAEIVQRSHGDADTVSVGDYHLAKLVGWALIGRPVDDDGMLELLAAWPGSRYRVVRLIEASGFRKPRFGPRLSHQDHRRH